MPIYTVAQRNAIGEIDRNLQIIACAGSDKTQVISARVVEILHRGQGNGVRPENIVAFTSDKAAAELKDRISRLVGAAGGGGTRAAGQARSCRTRPRELRSRGG